MRRGERAGSRMSGGPANGNVLRDPWRYLETCTRRMAQSTSSSLDDPFTFFPEQEVAADRSNSLVIRIMLGPLEDRETQMAALRSALAAGEDSGEAEPFDFDTFVVGKMA